MRHMTITEADNVAIRLETEILWPERCAGLERRLATATWLLDKALNLLDAASAHREAAGWSDAVSQMIARDNWGKYLTAIEDLRKKTATLTQKQA